MRERPEPTLTRLEVGIEGKAGVGGAGGQPVSTEAETTKAAEIRSKGSRGQERLSQEDRARGGKFKKKKKPNQNDILRK